MKKTKNRQIVFKHSQNFKQENVLQYTRVHTQTNKHTHTHTHTHAHTHTHTPHQHNII